jgi:SAM-dependent methyltransferase
MSRDAATEIQHRYTGDSGRTYHESRFAIPESAYLWVARLRAEKIAPHLDAQNTVVEFGVGHGWNLAALNCRARIGYDVADHVAPIVRSHGIEFVGEPEELRSGSANLLICHHVLEHVPSPAETLFELRRILAPDGRLLLFVPYETGRRSRQYLAEEPDHHLYSWTVQTLGNLVSACGFLPISIGIGEYGYDRLAAAWSCRLHLGEPGFRMLRRLALMLRPVREVRLVAAKRDA